MTEETVKERPKYYKWMNPSVEHLLAELIDLKKCVELFEKRIGSDPERAVIIANCRQKLDEVEKAINPDLWWQRRKIFTAWRLLHRIAEELIPLMTPEELSAQGQKLIHDIKMSSLADPMKLDWVGKLEEKMKKLENSPSDQEIKRISQFFKMAMNIINDHVDDRFWDIWSKKMLSLVYTLLLIPSIVFLIYLISSIQNNPSIASLSICQIILLGAIGGLVSGIISGEQEYLTKGHFWISSIYYPLIRPTLGALAAILIFWMLQAEYLIKIEPPLQDKGIQSIQSAQKAPQTKSGGEETPKPVEKDAAKTDQSDQKKGIDDNDKKKEKDDPLIVLRAKKGKEIYLYMIVLIAAGFSGDKLLKTVSDRVIARLYSQAEKTKEAK